MFDYIFNKELFTNVFWKLRDVKSWYVINRGGADSSKSWSQAQHEIIELLSDKYYTLVLRKVSADNEGTTFEQIKWVIESWDMDDEFTFLNSPSKRRIIYKDTGVQFIFRGLDDVGKLKSIAKIKRIWIEEANEITQEDFQELNRRIRGIENLQISLTFNPVSEMSWLKSFFWDIPEIAKRTTHIFSTIEDNQFALKSDYERLDLIKNYDINEYNIYRLGLWGKPGAKRPFAFAFKDRHIGHGLTHDAKLTVYLSFDFNVDPITCISVQYGYIKDRLWIHVIKEFRLPNSDIYALCKEIRTYFYETIYFKITGDATGRARTAMTKGHTNYYLIIKSELRLTNANFDVPSSNPSVKNTRVLMNTLFMREDFLIDDSCKYLIDDLHYVEVNEHGEVDKKKAEADGMNHLLDCLRYYCYRYHQRYLKNIPKNLIN